MCVLRVITRVTGTNHAKECELTAMFALLCCWLQSPRRSPHRAGYMAAAMGASAARLGGRQRAAGSTDAGGASMEQWLAGSAAAAAAAGKKGSCQWLLVLLRALRMIIHLLDWIWRAVPVLCDLKTG